VHQTFDLKMVAAMFVVICNVPTIDLAMFFSIKKNAVAKRTQRCNDVYVY